MNHVRKLSILLLIGTVLGLSACNTMRGVGEDTEAAGEKIQEVAEDAKN
jgi:predicted small secreted protein